MPDRATVALVTKRLTDCPQPHAIYITTYRHGTDTPQRVAQALHNARHRWQFPTYLTRYIVTAIMGADQDEDDGFGIGLEQPATSFGTEDGRPMLVVDLAREIVGYVEWGKTKMFDWWTYDGFIGAGRWPDR